MLKALGRRIVETGGISGDQITHDNLCVWVVATNFAGLYTSLSFCQSPPFLII